MKKFAARFAVRVLTALMQAICVVVIARQAGPAGLGFFVFALAIGAIAGTILGLGATTRALRVAREPDPVALGGSLSKVRLLSATGTSLAVVAGAMVGGSSALHAVALAFITAADHICDFEQALRAGLLKQLGSMRVLIYQRGFPLAGVLTAAMLDVDPISAYGAGSVVAIMILVPGLVKRGIAGGALRLGVQGSFPYWAGAIAQVLQQLDVVIIRGILGAGGVGLYAVGGRLVAPLGMVVNSAVVAISPQLGQIENWEERRFQFERFAAMAAVFGLVVSLSSPAAAWLIVGVVGEQYRHATPIIICVAVACGIAAVAQVVQSYFYFEGHVRVVTRINIVSVVTGLVNLSLMAKFAGTAWVGTGLLVNYSVCTMLLLVEWRRDGRAHTWPSHESDAVTLAGDRLVPERDGLKEARDSSPQ